MNITRRIRTIVHSENAGAVLVRRQPEQSRFLAIWGGGEEMSMLEEIWNCGLILNSHRKIEKWSEQKLRQTRRRTQAGLTPGKDDNEVWHNSCRNR